MIRHCNLAAFALFASTISASAEGFALRDFTKLTFDPAIFPAKQFVMRNDEPDRATIACLDCQDLTAVDVLLGQSTDGTEQRFRSGETTLEAMAQKCKAKTPSCTMEKTEFGKAIGWTSRYELSATTAGSTTILFLDGDLLTLRSVAATTGEAYANGQAVLASIGGQIIGR